MRRFGGVLRHVGRSGDADCAGTKPFLPERNTSVHFMKNQWENARIVNKFGVRKHVDRLLSEFVWAQ